jgi:hypothetical protein
MANDVSNKNNGNRAKKGGLHNTPLLFFHLTTGSTRARSQSNYFTHRADSARPSQ